MDKKNNPWLGLKTYSEGQTLYGRFDEIQTLSHDIIYNRQTVVYGKSGIGKSSLIKAGVFPILRKSHMFPVSIRLDHKDEKNSYFSQIKAELKKSIEHLRRDVIGEDGTTQTIFDLKGSMEELCLAFPRGKEESMWEYFHRHKFYDETHEEIQPVIVIDQFEEIFTMCKDQAKRIDFFEQLADLINDVPPSYLYESKDDDYVDIETYDDEDDEDDEGVDDLIIIEDEEEGEGQFGQQYLKECNYHVVLSLREEFLPQLERYTTGIPLLKHNRFGLNPLSDDQAASIITDPRPGLVSQEVAVEIIGKVTNAQPNDIILGDGKTQSNVDSAILSLFLSELYEKLDPEDTHISIELVREIGDDIISDFYERIISNISPASAEFLEEELVTEDEARDSIIIKRDKLPPPLTTKELDYLIENRLLHEFPWNKDMRIEFMHDRLCSVIAARKKNRAALKEQKEIELRHERETQLLRERNRRRIKKFGIIALTTILAAVVLGAIIRYWLFNAPYSCTYGNFTTLNGWPVGLGEKINPNDKEVKDKLIVYYRLTRYGRLNRNPFHKVEVISTYDQKPTTNKFIESPAVGLWYSELGEDDIAKAFAELQRKTVYWIYSSNDQELTTAGRCTAFDSNNNKLYSVQFNRENATAGLSEKKYVQWAVYYDANDKPMTINYNGIDRMRQTIDNGRVTSCLFFSMLGVPQKNERGAYGYQYDINDTTHLLRKVYRVGKFGITTDEKPINYIGHEYGRPKKTSLYEVTYPQPGMIVRHYKDYSDTLAFYENGILKEGSLHPDINRKDFIISFSYDEKGRTVAKQIRSKGNIVKSKAFTYLDNKVKEIKIIDNGESYSELYEYPDSTTSVVSLWKDGKKAMLSLLNEKGDELCYHSCTTTKRTDSIYSIETREYRDSVGNLIKPEPSDEYVNQYCKFEIYRDKLSNNILFEYYYNANGDIQKSELFEYDEYGNLIAKGVAGVDFTLVRCPDWNWQGLCCYKMRFLNMFDSFVLNTRAYDEVYISMSGINEFDESSLILSKYHNQLFNITINDSPMRFFSDTKTNKRIINTGFQLSETIIASCDMKQSAYFIHILSKEGTCYQAKLKDGDIVIRIDGNLINSASARQLEERGNCKVEVARPNPRKNSYDILHFTIPAGTPRVHVHQIQLTTHEYNRLNMTK